MSGYWIIITIRLYCLLFPTTPQPQMLKRRLLVDSGTCSGPQGCHGVVLFLPKDNKVLRLLNRSHDPLSGFVGQVV